jgi:hypothetical protein
MLVYSAAIKARSQPNKSFVSSSIDMLRWDNAVEA